MIIAAAPRAIPSLRVFHMAVNAECFEERSITMTLSNAFTAGCGTTSGQGWRQSVCNGKTRTLASRF